MLKACIVITAFNGDDDLHEAIRSLHRQSRKDFEVVIVNNSHWPLKNTESWSEFKWLKIIQSNQNSGFSGGSNLGAKGTTAEWIITLNPDAWPKPDWFEKLMIAADNFKKYDMLSSTLIKSENQSVLDGAGDCFSIFGIGWRGGQGQNIENLPKRHREVLAPCGAAAAYRREIFEKNNGFDTDYFCYLEDLDLGLRLQSQGHKCLHVFDAELLHVGGGSVEVSNSFKFYHTHKNQVRLIAKLTPGWLLPIHLLLNLAGQSYLIMRTSASLGRYSKWRGFKHGIVAIPMVLMRSRRESQANRKISTWEYAKLISWSFFKLRQKSL